MTDVSDNVSIEEMYKELEGFGVKRESLEKIHPSSETISHLYLSIKNQQK